MIPGAQLHLLKSSTHLFISSNRVGILFLFFNFYIYVFIFPHLLNVFNHLQYVDICQVIILSFKLSIIHLTVSWTCSRFLKHLGGSTVKIMYCSYRVLEYSSQHIHQVAHINVGTKLNLMLYLYQHTSNLFFFFYSLLQRYLSYVLSSHITSQQTGNFAFWFFLLSVISLFIIIPLVKNYHFLYFFLFCY